MKRIFSLILTFSMILCLFSCSSSKDNSEVTVNGENAINTENRIESITKKIVTTIAEVVSNNHPTEKETENESDQTAVNFQNRGCQPIIAVNSTANLAFELLKANLKTANAVISPASVAIALTMAGSGAKGETLDEFTEILGCDITGMQNFIEKYINEVNSSSESGIKLANSVWFNGQKGRLKINSHFENLCRNRFSADVFKDEFGNSTADKINGWISKKTDGLIENVIGEVPESAVAYLINTVLFESEWSSNYSPYDAVPNSLFTTADGRKQSVTMLKSTEGVNETSHFRLGKTEVVCKNYKNGYTFAAMLPDEGVSIAKALDSFSGSDFVKAATRSNTDENGEPLCGVYLLNVYLPKFEFECKFRLSEVLKSMGMTKAFDFLQADFTGMATSSRGNIFINEVYHNTYIKLDEHGTKAAAATVVETVDATCEEVAPEKTKTIRFDRPFIYVVFAPDGMPLFAGTVTDFDAK